MRISETSVTPMNATNNAQSTTTSDDAAFNAMRTLSEREATAKMFAEVHKAEAKAKITPPPTVIHAVIQAVDTASNAWEVLDNLSGLFAAIEQLSDKYSTIRKLASSGKYLADDWANYHDCQRGEWQGKLDVLKANREEVTA